MTLEKQAKIDNMLALLDRLIILDKQDHSFVTEIDRLVSAIQTEVLP